MKIIRMSMDSVEDAQFDEVTEVTVYDPLCKAYLESITEALQDLDEMAEQFGWEDGVGECAFRIATELLERVRMSKERS